MSRELMIAMILELNPNNVRSELDRCSDAILKDLLGYWLQTCNEAKTDECEHDDIDHKGYCLDCGECFIEDMMCSAYDYAKAKRQDSDT